MPRCQLHVARPVQRTAGGVIKKDARKARDVLSVALKREYETPEPDDGTRVVCYIALRGIAVENCGEG